MEWPLIWKLFQFAVVLFVLWLVTLAGVSVGRWTALFFVCVAVAVAYGVTKGLTAIADRLRNGRQQPHALGQNAGVERRQQPAREWDGNMRKRLGEG